ncbi:sensor box histidine kinase [Natronomonas moolapensis 8.8.11]|uniref:histidine kinase n=1 Tax=Natronomonas moolapensis (strain DSM 18674 / CECT 7526 / JCM 14361 / 8.8.11) TaxID=268739 RepID=M1XPY8_NATM8|nr:histidine kinase N-terminal 7TM domain-containing protein [Natronomonas moolapensis]CCQ36148.1 sensor box histidine kinase [Natronomonas moolapensis 8.8.11]
MGLAAFGSMAMAGLVVSHVGAAVLSLGLCVYVGRNHWHQPLGRAFVGMVGMTTIWMVASIARLFATSLDAFVAVSVVKYVGISMLVPSLLVFALLYDGREYLLTNRRLAALLAIPVASLPVVATTQFHELFYTAYETRSLASLSVIAIVEVGPLYWVLLVYIWTIFVVASALLVYAGFRRSRFYRSQLVFVLLGVLAAWVANFAYVFFNWPHAAVDPTPFGLALANALLALGVFSSDLVDISPAARYAVLDAIEDGVVVLDHDDRVVDVNDAARPLMESNGTIGEPVTEVFPQKITGSETGGATTVELTVDSRRRFYRRRRLPIGSKGSKKSVIVLTDVTAETESQQQAEQARRRLRQAIDLIPDPIFAKDLDDEVLLSNEANATLHGMKPAEIEGKRERDIEPEVENIDDFDKYRQRELAAVKTGGPLTSEEELMGPDGKTKVFKTTRIPFETAGDDESAVLGYARDVTDLKEYEQELEATKERLERTNEELETLNRILRHDIGNDAVVIGRLAQKLEQHVDEDGQEHLDNLLDRGEHIAEMTTNLRNLMQAMLDERSELEPVRLDTILEAEIESMSASHENASVTVDGDIPRASVRADRMLSSVFQNLLRNAIQHNDKAVPEVTVAAHDREESVVVEVADNGPGVPDDSKDDIFGKGERGLQSKGTGVGLYLVTKLLDRYGGTVHVRNRVLSNATDNRGVDDDGRLRLAAGAPATEQGEPDGSVFVVELPAVTGENR